jgi:hypothetical protein
MPIRINLLAEAQAAEELRRKDPVKRAMFMGAGCVVLMAVASLFLQSQVVHTRHEANDYTSKINDISNDYSVVTETLDRLEEVNLNTRGLDILASERFLYGTLLNSLQKVYVDNVQLVHLRAEQNYSITEEKRDKKDPKKAVNPGTSTERLTIIIEARDTSDDPGGQVDKFKEALAQNAYFQSLIGPDNEIRLVELSAPQQAGDLGRSVVQFTLVCRLPEKVRLGISAPTRYMPAAPAKPAPTGKPAGPVKL